MKQSQEIDKITLDESQATEIGKLLLLEPKGTKVMDFLTDLLQIGVQVNAGRAALVAILHLRSRKMVQHHLHHGEFVEVGIEKRLNDHGLRHFFGNHSTAPQGLGSSLTVWHALSKMRIPLFYGLVLP